MALPSVGECGYRCLIDIFGDLLAELPELAEGELLPSPESLRGKIVIKGKVVKEGEVSHIWETKVPLASARSSQPCCFPIIFIIFAHFFTDG